ncbi:MAG: pentapeptide repeat-containing protein [Cyanobacteria bacterium P01_A01_bin.40]
MADKRHLEILRKSLLDPSLDYWNTLREDSNIEPNLNGANLNNEKLNGANFNGADLNDASLDGANLERANLKRASLERANLSRANLYRASLNGANLDSANLERTILNSTNLDSANLNNANLERAILNDSYLNQANLERSNLERSTLRNANLYRANLRGANLKGAILRLADLRGADLSGAILDNAILYGVILNGANLSGVNFYDRNFSGKSLMDTNLTDMILIRFQALGTNFEGATLTGACIEDWNINSKTNLGNVKCNYIYLKGNYSEEEKKWIFSDRRPHDPNKIFAPGEFTKLFQKALETVDLIFSEGIEWTAFLESFQQLQAEVKSEELSIQAIEKKSGGAFVIRLEVPREANKAEIEKYIKQEYDAKLTVIEANYQKQLKAKNETIQAKNEDLIKAYREKGTDLLKMAEIMSSFQQNTIINNSPNLTPGNIYNIEKAGIGHNDNSNISGNSKVAGEFNEAEQEDLTEDE